MSAVNILSSSTNPNKVIITQEKKTDEDGDVFTLKVWPSCCLGIFEHLEKDGRFICDCGLTRVNVGIWEKWFFLTDVSARVLPEWIALWTGLDAEGLEVRVAWNEDPPEL